MATVDVSGTTSGGHPSMRGARPVYFLEKWVDIADVLTEKGSALAAADVFQVMDIEADTYVIKAGFDVVTACDPTAVTFDLGDGSDADGYVDGADGTTAGTSMSDLALTEAAPNTVTGYTAGKLYTADDTLDLTVATLTGTMTTGLLRVFVIAVDLSDTTQPQSAKERDGLSLP